MKEKKMSEAELRDYFLKNWKRLESKGNLKYINEEIIKGKRKKLIINTKRD